MASWTKRQLLEQAYTEIGKASYDFDLQPEELQSGLRSLDAMMATWAGSGISIGWIGGDGSGEIDVMSNVPAWAMEAIFLNLALRLAPSFGKTPSPDTRMNAKSAKSTVLARCVEARNREPSGYAGSGNQWGNLRESIEPLTNDSGNVIIGG